MKIQLPQVTLLGIDCVNVERLKVALDISSQEIDFGGMELLSSLPTNDKRLVTIPTLSSTEAYSRFCIQELHKYVQTEYVLIVQYDGFVLNPQSWTENFLQYDYIGAPLSWGQQVQNEERPTFSVGSGGFCLRSKRFIEVSAKFASEGKIEKYHPEDASLCLWYRDLFEKEGLRYAPVDLAMKFSVVEDYGVYDKPFGFHGLFHKNMEALLAKHPDFPTQNYMPRLLRKRIEKMKERYEMVALEGYVSKDNDTVEFVIKDEDFSACIENRHSHFAKISDTIISISEPQTWDVDTKEFRSEVVYQTTLGIYKLEYVFCKQSTFVQKLGFRKLF